MLCRMARSHTAYIINLVENDEKKIYLGLAYYIVSEYFEYMSFEYVSEYPTVP